MHWPSDRVASSILGRVRHSNALFNPVLHEDNRLCARVEELPCYTSPGARVKCSRSFRRYRVRIAYAFLALTLLIVDSAKGEKLFFPREASTVSGTSLTLPGSLHEGSYTLRVVAEDDDGKKSGQATLAIKILPPWYRTWWMYLVYT